MLKDKSKRPLVQMQLDFGQKNFGSIVCRSCGMVYVPSVKEDADQHAKFHKAASGPAGKLSRRKNDKVLEQFFDGSRVISVERSDFLSQERFSVVRQRLQVELGRDNLEKSRTISENAHDNSGQGRDSLLVLLLVAPDGGVSGCCIAEQIEVAHRLLVKHGGGGGGGGGGRSGAWEVAETREKALVGVYRLWVAPSDRGKGLGTALVDCARRHLIYGLPVSKEQVAFSDPTAQGRDFAAKYFGRDDFLVYVMPKSDST